MTSTTLWSAQAQMPTIMDRRIVISRGEGAYVFTDQGQRLLDATAGLWHANVGHGRQELAQAAFDQMSKLETYHTFNRFANDVAISLADRLAGLVPIAQPKFIFGSGGSEAVETACKLARRHWQLQGCPDKKIILSRRFAYHGVHTFGTSIAGIVTNREGYGSASLVPETAIIDHLDISDAEETIRRLGAENIAAIIAEPIMGTGGVFPPPPGYLKQLRALASANDILLIADEVITGFGRTGKMFASQRYEIEPDLMLLAKGITSGYLPLGGVVVAPVVWKQFFADESSPIYRHGTTYAGHATACAVAHAHLDILHRERLVDRAGDLEQVLDRSLDRLRKLNQVHDVRIGGFLAGIELHPSVPADEVANEAIEEGLILRALRGNTIQVSPPFIVGEEDIEFIAVTLENLVSKKTVKR